MSGDAQTTADEQAVAALGPDARPSGRLRLLMTGTNARLQHEWYGMLGKFWIDVPKVFVDVLPASGGEDGR